jgi:hypothetical protein
MFNAGQSRTEDQVLDYKLPHLPVSLHVGNGAEHGCDFRASLMGRYFF